MNKQALFQIRTAYHIRKALPKIFYKTVTLNILLSKYVYWDSISTKFLL